MLLHATKQSQINNRKRLLPKAWDPAFDNHLTRNHKVIILVMSFRTGSTFMGELFNQNPDILYDFEPFHIGGLKNKRRKGLYKGEHLRHTEDELNMLYLQQILHNCSMINNAFGKLLHKHWCCGNDPEENMELFGHETCDENTSRDPSQVRSIRQYFCKKRNAVALKVIRLRRLKDLELIKNIHEADVRVIHVLRDPRGMFGSRSGFPDIFYAMKYQLRWTTHEDEWQKLALEAQSECEKFIRDIEYAENSLWLKNRYLQVKYGEMAKNYQTVVKNIYEFIGEQLPRAVIEHLKISVNAAEVSNLSPKNNADRGGALDTFKNSTEVNEKWLQWKINRIRLVDKNCHLFIKKMNWPFMNDHENRNFEFLPERKQDF